MPFLRPSLRVDSKSAFRWLSPWDASSSHAESDRTEEMEAVLARMLAQEQANGDGRRLIRHLLISRPRDEGQGA